MFIERMKNEFIYTLSPLKEDSGSIQTYTEGFKTALTCLRKIQGQCGRWQSGKWPSAALTGTPERRGNWCGLPSYHILCRANLFTLMKNLKLWLRFWYPKAFIKPNKYCPSSFATLSCLKVSCSLPDDGIKVSFRIKGTIPIGVKPPYKWERLC